jgi:hypothetical protein
MSSDTPRMNTVLQTNLISLEAGSAMKDVIAAIRLLATTLTEEGKKLERELTEANARLESEKMTRNCIISKGVEMEKELKAMTDKADSLTALYIEAKRERDELQVLLQQTRHERDMARECLREAIQYRNREMSGYDLSKWEEAAK